LAADGIGQRSALLRLLEAPPGHYDVQLDADGRERWLTWLDTYAQCLGHFDDAQERELIELRSRSVELLVERASHRTAAVTWE
jgi:hypothetical protein